MERKVVGWATLFGGFWVVAAILVFLLAPTSPAVKLVSDGFPLLLSLTGVGVAFVLFRREIRNPVGARVWGSMALGLGLYSLGEAIWSVYELVLHQEVPYPSIADVAWMAGYIPLAVSLVIQFGSLRATVSTAKKTLIALFGAVMIALAVWLVILPILTSPDAGKPVEVFFSIGYPVEDLVLLVLSATLVLTLFGGRLAVSWGSIAGGILLLALSDLLFSYGTWNNLYYPDGKLNLLSAAFDTLYIGAYALWNIGLILRWRLPDAGRDVDVHRLLAEGSAAEPENREYLVMTDAEGKIVFIDPPLVDLLGQADAAPWLGKPFAQLIGLETRNAEAAIRKAARQGISDPYRVTLGRAAEPYQLVAIASDDREQFPGFDIVLHRANSRLTAQSDRESLLLSQIARRARELEKDQRQSAQEDFLRVYFNALVGLFYIMVCRAGGAGLGASFETELNQKASQLDCRLVFRKGHLVWNESGTDPAKYQALLEAAVANAKRAVSAPTLDRKMQEIERFLTPQVVMAAEENRLRMIRWMNEKPG